MSTTATPYGLIPIKKLGGQPYNNSFSTYKIPSGYNTAIYKGDLVLLTAAAGTIGKDTGTTSATPIGVFVGCSYTDPGAKQKWFKDFWTASTVASDAVAYVVDDPDVIFKIQSDGAGVVFGQENVGTNAPLVQGSGNATTGVSGVSFNGSDVAGTSTFPIKIVGIDPSPTNALTDTYLDVWCIINIGTHFWRTAAANAAS